MVGFIITVHLIQVLIRVYGKLLAKEGSNDKHRSLHKMSIEDNRTIEVIYSGQMEFLNISDKLIVLKYQM